MKNIFIIINSVILIFILSSCFGSKEDSSSSKDTLKSDCGYGMSDEASADCATPKEYDSDDDDDDDTDYEKFNKVLASQINCNNDDKFFDYSLNNGEGECTSNQLTDCSDDNINNILKKSGQEMEDESDWNWSDHLCGGSQEDNDSSHRGQDILKYRQCYLDKDEKVLRIYRIFDDDGTTVISHCELSNINSDYDTEDEEEEESED